MTVLATIETDTDAFERFLYTVSCWATKRYSPIGPSRCIVSEDGVEVHGGGTSQGMLCYSNFHSSYFEDISVSVDESVEAWFDVEDAEEKLEVVDPLASIGLHGEAGEKNAQVHLNSEEGSLSAKVPKSDQGTNDLSNIFADDKVTFRGKPTEIEIRTKVSEVQKIVDVIDEHRVDAYPLLVRDGELLLDHPIGSQDTDVLDTDGDNTLFWRELEAEVTGPDTLNFHDKNLKRALHCLKRWIDEDAEIELHTSPYAAEPVGSQEVLAIVYRGDQMMLGYILPPTDPDDSPDDWVL